MNCRNILAILIIDSDDLIKYYDRYYLVPQYQYYACEWRLVDILRNFLANISNFMEEDWCCVWQSANIRYKFLSCARVVRFSTAWCCGAVIMQLDDKCIKFMAQMLLMAPF